MNGVTITEEPIPSAPMSHAQDRRDLVEEIKLLETALFSKKERLAAMPHIHGGKIVLKAPSMFRCQSCGNGECLSHCSPDLAHPENKWPLLVIHNHTAEHGCLDWLPPKNEVQ